MLCGRGDGVAAAGILGVLFLPSLAQRVVEALVESQRKLIRPPCLVEGDGAADIIDHHLAGVTTAQVPLEFLTKGRVHRPVHIVIQKFEQIVALHSTCLTRVEPPRRQRLQPDWPKPATSAFSPSLSRPGSASLT